MIGRYQEGFVSGANKARADHAYDQKIIDAAREWMVDRAPMDLAEKRLAVAIVRTYPDELHTRENCSCGVTDCDECPTAAQQETILRRWEMEIAQADAATLQMVKVEPVNSSSMEPM